MINHAVVELPPPDWPEFTWDQARLTRAETLFSERAGIVVGASLHLDTASRDILIVDIMSHEALDTSPIEGEALDRDSVQPSIRLQLGLAADRRSVGPAEAGIADERCCGVTVNARQPATTSAFGSSRSQR